ncbi:MULTISPECIES: DeoR/GlpR family DNA-binding transcription regulator [Streptomyces]|uniref:DeoR/GlpR family DNA-binding transcription regulator n=1 Tax=Streptomyces TaxID=1883 RepID=UPI00198D1B95|nr:MULTISPECIES: DeoR/GlpR family DNA-binding transcription regulator [Streptomyces]GHD77458.1 DeoR family transcriptional regulator [Streptomyces mirabilis]
MSESDGTVVTDESDDRGALRPSQRQQRILTQVIKQGSVRNEELAEQFGVSVMTILRDVTALDRQGLLRRTRGGASVEPSALFESSVIVRLESQAAAKRAIARAVLQYVEPGQAIMLDDSTTGIHFARMLRDAGPATVISNFLPIIRELKGAPGIRLIGLGGMYHEAGDAFLGGMTVDAIRGLSVDLTVLSTSAITAGTCYHQTQDTVSFKRAMMDVAAKRILYVDHTKFERRALHALAPLTDFDLVIVDEDTPKSVLKDLYDRQVTIEVAKTG